MVLSKAELKDIPELMSHFRKAHELGFPGVFDETKVLQTLERIIVGDPTENIIFLCYKDQLPVGSIVLTTFEPVWSRDLFVTELSFWVDPSNKKAFIYLTDASVEWARRIGARGIQIGIVQDKRSWHGFTSAEQMYVKEF